MVVALCLPEVLSAQALASAAKRHSPRARIIGRGEKKKRAIVSDRHRSLVAAGISEPSLSLSFSAERRSTGLTYWSWTLEALDPTLADTAD
jgi:hypothetical protein